MIIYISGAITLNLDYAEQFGEAERVLTEMGHIVLNPAYLPQGLGSCDDYMKLCLPMVDLCDAVVMLPGWEDSRGACREWGYAMALKKEVIKYTDPLAVDTISEREGMKSALDKIDASMYGYLLKVMLEDVLSESKGD